MEAGDLKEIEDLTQRFVRDEGVAMEFYELVDRVTAARDPTALPALRRALSAAVAYQARWASISATTNSRFKKNAPGGWMIDAAASYATEYVTRLRNAIEACTPEGEPVVYEANGKRRWWQRGT